MNFELNNSPDSPLDYQMVKEIEHVKKTSIGLAQFLNTFLFDILGDDRYQLIGIYIDKWNEYKEQYKKNNADTRKRSDNPAYYGFLNQSNKELCEELDYHSKNLSATKMDIILAIIHRVYTDEKLFKKIFIHHLSNYSEYYGKNLVMTFYENRKGDIELNRYIDQYRVRHSNKQIINKFKHPRHYIVALKSHIEDNPVLAGELQQRYRDIISEEETIAKSDGDQERYYRIVTIIDNKPEWLPALYDDLKEYGILSLPQLFKAILEMLREHEDLQIRLRPYVSLTKCDKERERVIAILESTQDIEKRTKLAEEYGTTVNGLYQIRFKHRNQG